MKERPERDQVAPIYTHLTDLVDKTLCPKMDGNEFHSKMCCERECVNRGVSLSNFFPRKKALKKTVLRLNGSDLSMLLWVKTEDYKWSKKESNTAR